MLQRGVPATAKAYEFYLRANQLGYEPGQWAIARDLYLRCLDEDPRFAPAWARLGRIYRVLAMNQPDGADDNYDRAREAFRRALEINPELPVAHNLVTYLEVDRGQAKQAMQRLLKRAQARAADAELYAGLVQACRYCGLFEVAIAADAEARRIDPGIRTSVVHAHFMVGDYERALELGRDEHAGIRAMILTMMDRQPEALELLRKASVGAPPPGLHIMSLAIASLEGDRTRAQRIASELFDGWMPSDPCALYYSGRSVAHIGDVTRALAMLRRSVDGGHTIFKCLARDPYLDGLRGEPEFRRLLHAAEEGYRDARAALLEAGGDRLFNLDHV